MGSDGAFHLSRDKFAPSGSREMKNGLDAEGRFPVSNPVRWKAPCQSRRWRWRFGRRGFFCPGPFERTTPLPLPRP